MPKINWEELDLIIHDLKNDRTVIRGVVDMLMRLDKRIVRLEDRLNEIILKNGENSE